MGTKQLKTFAGSYLPERIWSIDQLRCPRNWS